MKVRLQPDKKGKLIPIYEMHGIAARGKYRPNGIPARVTKAQRRKS